MGRTAKLDTHLDRQRREDLTFLAEQGETWENAAKRLGLTLTALDQWCQRHDKPLRARLKANGEERVGTPRQATVRRR